MTKPRISVILPAYNAGRYLREAVQSILDQTYTDFEILLLNDGSTDDTEQVALSFTDPRVRYIPNPHNMGLANTINRGISLAQGELIARMDADDISLPTRFQTQVEYLEAHPEVMLCSCGIQQFGAADRLMIGKNNFEQVKVDMLFSSAIGHASSMWRRAFFEENNLLFDQDEFPAEDYGLWARAVFCGTLVNTPEVLYRYRIYPEQVTATDKRSHVCCQDIRRRYILRICPTISVVDMEAFLRLCESVTYNDWRQAQRFVKAFIQDNTFLRTARLRKTLYSYLSQMAQDGARSPQTTGWQRLYLRCMGEIYRIRRGLVKV